MESQSQFKEVWGLDLSWVEEPIATGAFVLVLWLSVCIRLIYVGKNPKVKDLKGFLDESLGLVFALSSIPLAVCHLILAAYQSFGAGTYSWSKSLWSILCLYSMVVAFRGVLHRLRDTMSLEDLEDPVVEDPVVEDPVVEDPVVEDPVVEDPVVEAASSRGSGDGELGNRVPAKPAPRARRPGKATPKKKGTAA